MGALRRWRFELFVLCLVTVELVTVAAAGVPRAATALLLTGLSGAVLLGCRWRPLTSCVAAFALLTASLTVMPRSTPAQFFGVLATFAVAGAMNRERDAVLAWAAGAAMLAYGAYVDPLGGGTSDFLLSLAFGTALWAAGVVVSQRGRRVAEAVEAARVAELDNERRTQQALAEERARIARELHDIVSHALSVVVVQTLAARGALRDSEEGASDPLDRRLEAVESTARDALSEMRRMLGLLQNTDFPDEGTAPAPGVARLGELVRRLDIDAEARLEVDLGCPLPPGLDLTVYRVVQEALTNAVKHAPGAPVTIDVRSRPREVVVTVTNDPAVEVVGKQGEPGGRGLVGMRERVAVYGGTLSVGRTPCGGFRVEARFPLDGQETVTDTRSSVGRISDSPT